MVQIETREAVDNTALVPGFELGALIERGCDFTSPARTSESSGVGWRIRSKDYWKSPRRADAAEEWRTTTEGTDTRRKGCIRRPMDRTWASP